MSKTPSFSKKVNDFDGENRGIRNFPIMFGERIHLAAYERTLKDNLSILDKYENDARAALQRLTAAERGKEALTKEVNQMQEEERRKRQFLERKKSVLESEKERASKLISKDPPIPLSVRSLLNENFQDEDVDSCTENKTDNAKKSSIGIEDDKENLLSEMQAEDKQAQLKEWNAKAKKRFNSSLRKDRLKKEYDETIKVLENAERFKRRQFAQQLSSNKEMWYPCDQADRLKNSEKQVRMQNAVETVLKIDGKYKSKEHAIDDLEGYKDLLEPNVKNIEFDLSAKQEKLLACVPKFIQKNYQYLLEEEKSEYVFGQNLDESGEDTFNTAYIESPPYETDEQTGDDLEEIIKKIKQRRSELLSRYEEELISDEEDKHGDDKHAEVKHGKDKHAEVKHDKDKHAEVKHREDKHSEGAHKTVSDKFVVDKAVETEAQSSVDEGTSTDARGTRNKGILTDKHGPQTEGISTDRHLFEDRGTSTDILVSRNKGISTDKHGFEKVEISIDRHAFKDRRISADRPLSEDIGTSTDALVSRNKGILTDKHGFESEEIPIDRHAFKDRISADRPLFEDIGTSTDILVSRNKGILTDKHGFENKEISIDRHAFKDKGISIDRHAFKDRISADRILFEDIGTSTDTLVSRNKGILTDKHGFENEEILIDRLAFKDSGILANRPLFEDIETSTDALVSRNKGILTDKPTFEEKDSATQPFITLRKKLLYSRSTQVDLNNAGFLAEARASKPRYKEFQEIFENSWPEPSHPNENRSEPESWASSSYCSLPSQHGMPKFSDQVKYPNQKCDLCTHEKGKAHKSEDGLVEVIVKNLPLQKSKKGVELISDSNLRDESTQVNSAEYLKTIAEKYFPMKALQIATANPVLNCAVPLSEPIRIRPIAPDTVQLNDVNTYSQPEMHLQLAKTAENIKDNGKNAIDIFHLDKPSHASSQISTKPPHFDEVDESKRDLSGLTSTSQSIASRVDESTIKESDKKKIFHQVISNYLPIVVNHVKSPPSSDQDSPSFDLDFDTSDAHEYVYHDLSTIQEVDSAFANSTLHQSTSLHQNTPPEYILPNASLVNGPPCKIIEASKNIHFESTTPIPFHKEIAFDFQTPSKNLVPLSVIITGDNSTSSSPAESLEQHTITSSISMSSIPNSVIATPEGEFPIQSSKSEQVLNDVSNLPAQVTRFPLPQDSPAIIAAAYVPQQNLDQTISSGQSLEQHTIQSDQSPLPIPSANKLLKDAKYCSLGLKNVSNTQDSNGNRDAYIPKQSFDQTTSTESLIQHTIQSNDSPILSDSKLVKDTECRPVDSTSSSYMQRPANDNKDIKIAKSFGQTFSSDESLEQHTIQSNQSPLPIPSANKLLKDAKYRSLGLKNVSNTQESNGNRDAYIPKQSFDQTASSSESLIQHTIQSNDSPIQTLSDFKLVKDTECRPVDSKSSSYMQRPANDNKDIKIAKSFGQDFSSEDSLEQHTIQSSISSVDLPVHHNQSKYKESHPVHSQDISRSQSKLLNSGVRLARPQSSSGVFYPMMPWSDFSQIGSSSNSSSGVFKSMVPYSGWSSESSSNGSREKSGLLKQDTIQYSSSALAASESEKGKARSTQWMPEAALKADYQVKRLPGLGIGAWENQPSTSKQKVIEQTAQQHAMIISAPTPSEEYRVTTPLMGSSDESLSAMFSGSRIAFQSTPIRTVEDLAQEDGLMEEPDLTLVTSERSSTVTTPEKFRNQSASDLKHDDTIDSLLSQLRNASHQQERKEIIKSDFSSNVAIKTTLHVQDTKICLQENVSESMMSFLQHEISCCIETCSSSALYEEKANQPHTQFATHSTDTSDNTHSSNPSENVHSDSHDLPETMPSSSSHLSSLNPKSDFKTRTKRLWKNLEEVKQKKLSDERQKKMALSKKKMKEYSQKITRKNKMATPKK